MTPEQREALIAGVAALEGAESAHYFLYCRADAEGEPLLMVQRVEHFRLHRSLRRVVQRFRASAGCEIRVNSAFDAVITACARAARQGQSGTWIGPRILNAYTALHRAGHAFSVETWIDGRLRGGLYGVSIGRAGQAHDRGERGVGAQPHGVGRPGAGRDGARGDLDLS